MPENAGERLRLKLDGLVALAGLREQRDWDEAVKSWRETAARLSGRYPSGRVKRSTVDGWTQGQHLPRTEDQLLKAVLAAMAALAGKRQQRLTEEEVRRGAHDWLALYRQAREERRARSSPGGPPAVEPPMADDLHLEVVRSIAPADGLKGRDAELAELASFCTEPGDGYAWWQAEPWAGKSALLSTFVLHPPPGVVPVSFFITGRQAGQDTSEALVRDVTAQLERLTEADRPALSSSRDQVAFMHLLLRRYALALHREGQQLVLVIDGLDEDASSMAGTSSAASVLPKRLEHGGKMIVSSRLGLRLPADVPGDHALWRPGIVRVLPPSGYATTSRVAAEGELAHLLADRSGPGRDVLGLLVAARGGLTAGDLADLLKVAPGDLDRVLAVPTGRTFFTPRPIVIYRALPEEAPLIIAHEELDWEAARKLGPPLLRHYLSILDEWADGYRDRGWPPDTPVYLLRGYGEMLRQSHDDRRFAVLAADGKRLDRILHVTGGDGDSRAEVDAAMAASASARDPDLALVARLAYQRDRINGRNRTLPAELPAAWARAGQPDRGEALARSLTGDTRIAAVAYLSIALTEAGEAARANLLLDEACGLVGTVTGPPGGSAQAIGAVAAALARAGHVDRAEAMAASIEDSRARDYQLIDVTARMAAAGEHQRARALAAGIDDLPARVRALAGIARQLAEDGHVDQAARIAAEADAVATEIQDLTADSTAAGELAAVLALAGQPVRAEALALSLGEPGARAEALSCIAAATAEAGNTDLGMRLVGAAESLLDEEETTSGNLANPWPRLRATKALAQARVSAGELAAAESSLRSLPVGSGGANDLISLAEAMAAAGHAGQASLMLAEAEAAARGSSPVNGLAKALVTLAWAAIRAGEVGQADAILADVEAAGLDGPVGLGDLPLEDIAEALAAARQYDRAAAIIQAISDAQVQASARASVAIALAKAGLTDPALRMANTVTGTSARSYVYLRVAASCAGAGKITEARSAAAEISDEKRQSQALTAIAVALAHAGERDQAAALAGSVPSPSERPDAAARTAAAFAETGRVDDALALADGIDHPAIRARARAWICQSLAETGHAAVALPLARSIPHRGWRGAALASVAYAYADADADAEPTTQAEVLDEIHDCLATAARADEESMAMDKASGTFGPGAFGEGLVARVAAGSAAAAAFARAGQTSRAVEAAGRIPHPGSRRRALRTVAVTLAETGYPDEARDLAMTLTSRQNAPATLAEIAVVLARSGQERRARQMLAAAFREGPWTISAWALAVVSPPALLCLADDIRAAFRHALDT